jgi:hypothetical protein
VPGFDGKIVDGVHLPWWRGTAGTVMSELMDPPPATAALPVRTRLRVEPMNPPGFSQHLPQQVRCG